MTFGQHVFYSGTGFVVQELTFIEEIFFFNTPQVVLARDCPGCSSYFSWLDFNKNKTNLFSYTEEERAAFKRRGMMFVASNTSVCSLGNVM